MQIGGDIFFEIVVVDYFSSDSYFDFFIDVIHQWVKFFEIRCR